MSHLTIEQRDTNSVLLEENFSKSDIAIVIKKDKSVLTRELKRNCYLRSGKYDFDLAQRKYEKQQKDKTKRNDLIVKIKERIKEYLQQELSPEQIVGACSKNGLSCVPTESIYQHIWKDKKE
ncbi:MAG: IS30 family transposase [Flavobacteriales bacterium]|jgi:IS30 family transposase